MRIIALLMLPALSCGVDLLAQDAGIDKPRVLISTDIGGTDPDDNQSMAHLMMYSDMFDLEGIVSSPSYGSGSKEEILRMIDLYEQDFSKLMAHAPDLMTPDALRTISKQGRRGSAPLAGYAEPTEGSDWIVACAQRDDPRPLYVLVWGTLDDVAQALHDAPDIAQRIRIYWIGGPNKKWGVNAYAYIAEHYPDLWFIENNSTYRGIIASSSDADYYGNVISGAGALGEDFVNYYKGVVKMGDTPSLLYMINGDPADPTSDSWGGRFMAIDHSTRYVFHRQLTSRDTIATYSIMEIWMKGYVQADMAEGTACLTLTTDHQQWDGYYMGNGNYMVRYSPKGPGVQTYTITSDTPGISASGSFTVVVGWPAERRSTDYPLGPHWYSDCPEPKLYEGHWQGMKTQSQWRDEVLRDWARRWAWLKE